MITIICSGSRGDFQPYIALALELKKIGKDVRITGSRSFESFIRGYGIDFYSIQADIESLNVDPKMLKDAGSSDSPLKMLLTFNKMKKYGVYMVNDFYNACKGSELIIYHPGCTIGYFAAEQFGIPSVLATPFPMHKTKEQLSVVMYGKTKANAITKSISYSMIQGMLWMASKDCIKGFWKEKFGKLPINFGSPFERHTDKKHPAVISCSNFVFERPKDWDENIHQMGYWFVEEPNEYVPSEEFVNFLNSGEKPIYIGFGSMSAMEDKEELCKIAVDALAKSGRRGIICGMGANANLPDNIFKIDSIPHSWLFNKVSAVCHHGGAGTTAAGFRAGVPSIIVPFSNDQFAWAHRAYDLGVGAKPIPKKELTSDKLAAAINSIYEDTIINRARKLGESIATENGAKDCARIIADCTER
jgi:sterol 3beta-glucosyltransferase